MRLFACLTLAVSLFAGFCPQAAAAQRTDTALVIVNDKGMSPGRIVAHNDRPIHIHVVNRGHDFHQFSIPEFYIFTRTLAPGETSDITFAPYKVGRFSMMSDPSGTESPEFRASFVVR